MKSRAKAAISLSVLCAFLSIPSELLAATRYVNANSTNPVSPYIGWPTAARAIQDATGISADGDLVLVTNGYYTTGGATNFPGGSYLTNRVAMTNAITVQSVNGPDVTFIVGSGGPPGDAAIRCVAMAPGAVLSGFTISNGYTRIAGEYDDDRSGGGVWCSDGSILTNCIVVDNVSWKYGGGVYGGTLYNCTLDRNIAVAQGGGAYESYLQSCMLRGNQAFQGGGTYYSALYNCIVVSNTADFGGGVDGGDLHHCTVVANKASLAGGGVYEGTLNNCIVYHNDVVDTNREDNWFNGTIAFTCTDPLPAGEGNITNDPRLISISTGNFRLMSDSPCIDTGLNGVAPIDMDGLPRPLDGNLDGTNTADMGAYELANRAGDSDGDLMLDQWEIDHRLDPLNSADAGLDPDADGSGNRDEFIAGTNPTNPASYFHCTRVRQSATNELVTWNSAAGRLYWLERISSIASDTWSTVTAGLPAQPPENTYTDAVPLSTFPCFYRVRVNRTNAYYPP